MKNTKEGTQHTFNAYLVAAVCFISFALGGISVFLFITQDTALTASQEDPNPKIETLEQRLTAEEAQTKVLRDENALLKANIRQLEEEIQNTWLNINEAIADIHNHIKANQEELFHLHKRIDPKASTSPKSTKDPTAQGPH